MDKREGIILYIVKERVKIFKAGRIFNVWLGISSEVDWKYSMDYNKNSINQFTIVGIINIIENREWKGNKG